METLSVRKQLKYIVLFRAATARMNSNTNHNAAKLPRFDGFSLLFVPKKLVKLQAEIISKKIGERGGVVTPN